ncbi:holo-ACP synthase [Mobilitalea sibirica]|uniref:Holo-[acyl-carrier-protein] synthase n=1 Tax=Mobilitalea sibirica TaxID=1462919 RepID=A0A8J7HBC9_9FIRM|nr:holo-ACP synthase [Mobilitalea sibirica]MBH1942226.1 holo-ACP synthase [Mobilitalea sibirica]
MITGIGVDLIEVDRVLKACEKESFLNKYFTQEEVKMIKADRYKAAGNFAVKEAVSKMLGTGFRGILLSDIEVLRNELGKPFVTLYGKAAELAREQKVATIHVSISNTKDYANAFVIGETEAGV